MATTFTNPPANSGLGSSSKVEFDGLDLNDLGEEDDIQTGQTVEFLVDDEDDLGDGDELGDEENEADEADEILSDDDDSLFDADEDDETAPAKKPKKQAAPKPDIHTDALAELLRRTETKSKETAEVEPEKDDYEDWAKALVAETAVQIPAEYLSAIREGEPAQASKALNAVLAHQATKMLGGINERVKKQIDAKVQEMANGQQAQQQQARQAQQIQQQVESDFSARYSELDALSSHPDFGQYLTLAVQTVSNNPATKSMTQVPEFTKAVAAEATKLLRPVLAAAGMKFTKANLAKLAAKQKRSRSAPPAPMGGKTNSRKKKNQSLDAGGLSLDFEEM